MWACPYFSVNTETWMLASTTALCLNTARAFTSGSSLHVLLIFWAQGEEWEKESKRGFQSCLFGFFLGHSLPKCHGGAHASFTPPFTFPPALWKMLGRSHRRNLSSQNYLQCKERQVDRELFACSCQDTSQHCLHVSKSFSVLYEPTALTLQSPSTVHLHISTTSSKENHNLAQGVHRDQPQLQVIHSQHCSSGQQEEQLQPCWPDTEISRSSTFSEAHVPVKIARIAAVEGHLPCTSKSFSLLANLGACTLPRANLFSMSWKLIWKLF